MSAFDVMLREMGLSPKVYANGVLVDPITTGRTVYSTMGELVLNWVDQGGGVVAVTGICDAGHPPTLVHPRPAIAKRYTTHDGVMTCEMTRTSAVHVDRMVAKVGAREVLRMGMEGETWTDTSILDG